MVANKLLKRTLNSWLASFLAILANYFAPLSKALGAKESLILRCCRKKLSTPDIIDGTAYFVCPECGVVREVENYRVYTVEDAISYFENKYGFRLPKEYVNISGSRETKVVKLNSTDLESFNFYFGDGFYEIGRFASIDPNDENSIYNNVSSGRE